MEFVVDTSVIIAVIVNEPSKPALIRATQGVDLLAPSSVHWEIANAFSAMLLLSLAEQLKLQVMKVS
jgi:predicted nucleic acid-binding protein